MEETKISPLENWKRKEKLAENENDSGHVSESDDSLEYTENQETGEVEPYKLQIVWRNIAKFVILHGIFAYSTLYLSSLSWKMVLYVAGSTQFSGLGITMGAHRLWAHKTYKAKLPLRIFLTIANCMAGQNSIYIWSRDHRTHHKCSEKMGDPHNAKRGFFFAHMGWLLVKKHPEVIKAGKTVNMEDLEKDDLVMFQHRNYIPCFLTCGFVIPTLIPYFLWGEGLWVAYLMTVFRYVFTLHATWLVNSAAHFWGNKPYDKTIGPTENMAVSFLAMGEGFHNYHHTFPYDYSTSEWGYTLNVTTRFIDAMAFVGLAYDRKRASPEVIEARAGRTGYPELTALYQKKQKVF